MKDYTLRAHILGDTIIGDGIKGIKRLKDKRRVQGQICGGMAVASYLPIDFRRETVDLDYNLLWGGTTTEYKELVGPMVEELMGMGYSVRCSKAESTHDIIITTRDGNDSLLIQHKRRSANHLKKIERTLEREVENQRIISARDFSYAVLSPEDLILHKLSRSLRFIKEYDLKFPDSIPLGDLKFLADAKRDGIVSKVGSDNPVDLARDVAELRLIYDSYDIKCIAGNVGLNEGYFNDSLGDWILDERQLDDFKRAVEKLGVKLD